MRTKKLADIGTIFVICLIAFLLLLPHLGKPFIGHHDWNSVWYGAVVRNNLRYGVVPLRFGSTNASGPIDPATTGFHVSYTPVFSLIITGIVSVIGFSDYTLRLSAAIFGVFTLVTLYIAGKTLFSREAGIMAMLLYAATPLFRYFSLIPVHETIVMPFILLSIAAYVNLLKNKTTTTTRTFLLTTTLALGIAWPAHFLPFLYAIHAWFSKKDTSIFRIALYTMSISLAIVILHTLHMTWITGSPAGLFTQVKSRMTSEKTVTTDVTWLHVIYSQLQYFRIYYTDAILTASGIFIGWVSVTSFRKKHITSISALVLLFSLFGAAYALLFPEVVVIHDYFVIYFLPFFLLSAAFVFSHLCKLVSQKSTILATLFLVAVVLFVGLRRNQYVEALYTSNHSEKGYRLGLFIKNHSAFSERTAVGSDSFKQFYDVFISYYADRLVWYELKMNAEIAAKYDLIIRPKAHDAMDKASKNFLDENFTRHENEDYIWYTRGN